MAFATPLCTLRYKVNNYIGGLFDYTYTTNISKFNNNKALHNNECKLEKELFLSIKSSDNVLDKYQTNNLEYNIKNINVCNDKYVSLNSHVLYYSWIFHLYKDCYNKIKKYSINFLSNDVKKIALYFPGKNLLFTNKQINKQYLSKYLSNNTFKIYNKINSYLFIINKLVLIDNFYNNISLCHIIKYEISKSTDNLFMYIYNSLFRYIDKSEYYYDVNIQINKKLYTITNLKELINFSILYNLMSINDKYIDVDIINYRSIDYDRNIYNIFTNIDCKNMDIISANSLLYKFYNVDYARHKYSLNLSNKNILPNYIIYRKIGDVIKYIDLCNVDNGLNVSFGKIIYDVSNYFTNKAYPDINNYSDLYHMFKIIFNIFNENYLFKNVKRIHTYINGIQQACKNISVMYKQIFNKDINNKYILNRFIYNISGNKNINHSFIEVIKRWWIINPISQTDKIILPDTEYNYSNTPLVIDDIFAPAGSTALVKAHPISFMNYIDNKGQDLLYGIGEMPVSIDIVVDMVNIVGMLVHRMSSQFTNCSGQEAIEFLMEMILNWLNLESTISSMNENNSRLHYLRVYRWIRWEAEKVWFIANKDLLIDKFCGVKYTGMLLSNLIDYLKNHIFNMVPFWRNLKYMDIERQFGNKQPLNSDIIKQISKIKGKRHYKISSQNIYNKNNLFKKE